MKRRKGQKNKTGTGSTIAVFEAMTKLPSHADIAIASAIENPDSRITVIPSQKIASTSNVEPSDTRITVIPAQKKTSVSSVEHSGTRLTVISAPNEDINSDLIPRSPNYHFGLYVATSLDSMDIQQASSIRDNINKILSDAYHLSNSF